jgi:CelD/BcsL family acetyltransferase involved in cellulose biosynthesis
VKVVVARPRELGLTERQLWDSFTGDPSLASPFLSWEFANAVDATRTHARVAVVEDGAEICGFFAFDLRPNRIGEPIGAGICDAQAFVGRPDWDFDARGLIGGAGLASWRFDHLVPTQTTFAPYHRRLHRSPVVDLRAGFAPFLESVRAHSKDLLGQVARRRRRLEREHGPVVCEWQSSRRQADMAQLQHWKSLQYSRTNTWDRFAHAWVTETLSHLEQARDPGCTGLLTVLRVGDHLAAAHFGLLGHDRLSWWFPTYNPDLGRYSPGLILLFELIREAAQRQVTLVDLGRGAHGYKLRVTQDWYEVAEGEVTS